MNEFDNNSIVLFEDKNKCCACGACKSACPKQAITMKEDEYGFVYPVIDKSICIKCGKCKKVCNYQNDNIKEESKEAYVAAVKDINLLLKSASGGLFAALAETIIEEDGVVYGVSMNNVNNKLKPEHIRVTNKNSIEKLQGSKYVQSDTADSFVNIEKDLKEGRIVLFSGTPCQVAGLKGYLGKDYKNLYLVDIICHGVPSTKFFQDYISNLMKRWNGRILDFKLRDKKNGWGLNAKVVYKDKNNNTKVKRIPSGASSYFDMFLKSETYRQNCYSCPYATIKRIGDITIGDYWGIQKEHPELMDCNGGNYNDTNGISCLLVNNKKGNELLKLLNDKVNIDASTIEKVARKNGQLKHPSNYPETRKEILETYKEDGYDKVESYFKKRNGMRTQYYYIKNMIPHSLKKTLKGILKK